MGHFGTDGIRKKAVDFTKEYLEKIADGIVSLGKKIVIGRDPRESGEEISRVLCARMVARGAEVIDVGMVPTPCLSFLTVVFCADYGVMLSASHNPPEYNGVKLFASDGSKASEEEEKAVEKVIDEGIAYTEEEKGSFRKEPDAYKKYIDHLIERLRPDLTGTTVFLDTANGATSIIAPEVFRRAGATVLCFNAETDGKRINVGCGATAPSFIVGGSNDRAVDLAFAYDGDGDRVMAAKYGKLYDGDKIMYLCAKDMAARGTLNKNVVVGTVMSNMGTEIAMKKAGVTLVRADVGDKYVAREMRKNGYNLGGEQSGHILFFDYAPTGDGILSSLVFAMLDKKVDLPGYDEITDYPAVNDCILCTEEEKKKFLLLEGEIRAYLARLSDCRTVVRPSGTEPKIRILAEAATEEVAKRRAEEIKNYITEMIL